MKKTIALILIFTLFAASLIACVPQNAPHDTGEQTVNLIVLKDHDAVAAKMAAGEIDIAILPEPKATASINEVKKQGQNYHIALNLSTEWSAVSETELAMGCLIVKNEFITSHESTLLAFLNEYKASIEYVNNTENKDSAAQMIVDSGIIPKLPLAKSALDNLYGSIVYQDGAKMKDTLKGFYDAIKITQPKDGFYYMPDTSVSAEHKTKIKIGVMTGPTGMGMAKLIHDNGLDGEKYSFTAYPSPDLATAALTKGELDMLCVPTNLAANLSSKQEITAVSINCLGSLYVVVRDGVEINSVNDLIGKTVYYGVKTSTTEAIFEYILSKHSIKTYFPEE